MLSVLDLFKSINKPESQESENDYAWLISAQQ